MITLLVTMVLYSIGFNIIYIVQSIKHDEWDITEHFHVIPGVTGICCNVGTGILIGFLIVNYLP